MFIRHVPLWLSGKFSTFLTFPVWFDTLGWISSKQLTILGCLQCCFQQRAICLSTACCMWGGVGGECVARGKRLIEHMWLLWRKCVALHCWMSDLLQPHFSQYFIYQECCMLSLCSVIINNYICQLYINWLVCTNFYLIILHTVVSGRYKQWYPGSSLLKMPMGTTCCCCCCCLHALKVEVELSVTNRKYVINW